MGNDNPSERDVGARIRVKGEFADEATSAFDREGLSPLYIEKRADGDVSFWFGKLGDADLLRACKAIPREWYALSGNNRWWQLSTHSRHLLRELAAEGLI